MFRMRGFKIAALALICLPMAIWYTNCSPPNGGATGTSKSLRVAGAGSFAINPSSQTIAFGATIQFSVTGGVSPYSFSIVSGGGSINAGSGLFTAPTQNATVIVKVTDSANSAAIATISVINQVTLTANPTTVAAGGTSALSATGGSGNYTYSVVSGGGSISGSTYTAPNPVGVVVLQVTDSNGATGQTTLNAGVATSATKVPVYRFAAAIGGYYVYHYYALTMAEGTSAGYNYESTPFSVLTAPASGTIALYRCKFSGQFLFISTDVNCEGQTKVDTLGYAQAAQTSDTKALLRWVQSGSGDHLSTVDPNENASIYGYVQEATTGYVY